MDGCCREYASGPLGSWTVLNNVTLRGWIYHPEGPRDAGDALRAHS